MSTHINVSISILWFWLLAFTDPDDVDEGKNDDRTMQALGFSTSRSIKLIVSFPDNVSMTLPAPPHHMSEPIVVSCQVTPASKVPNGMTWILARFLPHPKDIPYTCRQAIKWTGNHHQRWQGYSRWNPSSSQRWLHHCHLMYILYPAHIEKCNQKLFPNSCIIIRIQRWSAVVKKENAAVKRFCVYWFPN